MSQYIYIYVYMHTYMRVQFCASDCCEISPYLLKLYACDQVLFIHSKLSTSDCTLRNIQLSLVFIWCRALLLCIMLCVTAGS